MVTDEEIANDVLAKALEGYAESAELGLLAFIANDKPQFGFEYGAWSAFAVILDTLGIPRPDGYDLNAACTDVVHIMYEVNKNA